MGLKNRGGDKDASVYLVIHAGLCNPPTSFVVCMTNLYKVYGYMRNLLLNVSWNLKTGCDGLSKYVGNEMGNS